MHITLCISLSYGSLERTAFPSYARIYTTHRYVDRHALPSDSHAAAAPRPLSWALGRSNARAFPDFGAFTDLGAFADLFAMPALEPSLDEPMSDG